MEDWPREPELSSASAGNSLDNLAQVTLPSRRATIGTEWRRSFKVESARICPGWFRSGRFLTPHRRRKKRPPTRSITSDQALLDDLYIGPTHVSPLFFCIVFPLLQFIALHISNFLCRRFWNVSTSGPSTHLL